MEWSALGVPRRMGQGVCLSIASNPVRIQAHPQHLLAFTHARPQERVQRINTLPVGQYGEATRERSCTRLPSPMSAAAHGTSPGAQRQSSHSDPT